MKKTSYILFIFGFLIILFNSLFDIYAKRKPILSKLGFNSEILNININKEISVNPLAYGIGQPEQVKIK